MILIEKYRPLRTCIWEVPASSLGRNTNYSEGFCRVFSVSRQMAGYYLKFSSSTFLPIHVSLSVNCLTCIPPVIARIVKYTTNNKCFGGKNRVIFQLFIPATSAVIGCVCAQYFPFLFILFYLCYYFDLFIKLFLWHVIFYSQVDMM
jgi:hypothetical protein